MSKDMQPVRIALLGCGAVSQLYYAPAIEQLERRGIGQLSAVYDPRDQNSARLLQAFPSARTMQSAGDFQDAELAIVASPPQFHAEQSIAALQAGLSVLCEKPMAVCLCAGEQMVQAAR